MLDRLTSYTIVLGALVLTACQSDHKSTSRICYSATFCVEPDGRQVLPDGRPICVLDNSCDGGSSTGGSTGDGSSTGGTTGTGPVISLCSCTDLAGDADGDCIVDSFELANSVSDPTLIDTDSDGINDGCEDLDHDGVVGVRETDPRDTDTDNDGIADGLEDRNHNGRVDSGESSPRSTDSDGDGIADGIEDVNHNGIVDAWTDTNSDGCFGVGDVAGESDAAVNRADTDGDQLLDGTEDANHNGIWDAGETSAWHNDSDCDGLDDGKEDLNRDGHVDNNETSPLVTDSDGDGINDGLEDSNHNGHWDSLDETSPLLVDSDSDGIRDGVEDSNHNGSVDAFEDSNLNGCWDQDEVPGESDPRDVDSDLDGLLDRNEDRNRDGECAAQLLPHPIYPDRMVWTFSETCAFHAETDCDGLSDGLEDRNRNGVVDSAETDPRNADTDLDGLIDGCTISVSLQSCEDKNNSGAQESGETNPVVADTDGDALPDGCEVSFGTSPVSEDTDGDGVPDGEEDANHNCAADSGETDPRIYDAPPQAGTGEYSQWNVCATQNLKQLSYVTASRDAYDYRLAFEVEKGVRSTTCPHGTDAECGSGARCDAGACIVETRYITAPFGKGVNSEPFDIDNESHALWGHIFQSPAGIMIDSATSTVLHRNVYGFVQTRQDNRSLDDILDSIRNGLLTSGRYAEVTEIATLPARPAHDSITSDNPLVQFRVNRAQRQFRIRVASSKSALAMRNQLLLQDFLGGQVPEPATVPPTVDPVYGPISCPGSTRCYTQFTVYIGMVQRVDQTGFIAGGGTVVLTTLALTPDDSDDAHPSNPANRFYADRLTRLEDLTGGSAMARYGAEISQICEDKAPTKAKVDMLWVVDDSRSMQQLIARLQSAASDAQAILTANSNIVDFRVAMTTTNASQGARTQCLSGCNTSCGGDNCSLCADQFMGCIAPTSDTGVINADATLFPLPGGGGTFYFEDSEYLDCDSSSTTGQVRYVNSCSADAYAAEFAPFYDTGMARKQLVDNAGFLATAPEASCNSELMDLSYKTSLSNTTCNADSSFCCPRLTESCEDGPTVLASQMCDLIRAMGGLPSVLNDNSITNGARPHSAPEHGIRSARRLIQTLLQEDEDAPADKMHLRYDCSAGPCKPVPLATIFISDEEDFWFKDDCQAQESDADLTQLAELCYGVDNDTATAEECTLQYCTDEGFLTAPPTGYDPDQAASNDAVGFTLQWRDSDAPQCAVSPSDTTCAAGTNTCAQYTSGDASTSNQRAAQRAACEADTECLWDQSKVTTISQRDACVMARPANDCQACKRLRRLNEAVNGGDALPGFSDIGPVYAITRNKGMPGYGGIGSGIPQDECAGGSLTWGRGDGSALRQLAIATQGRTQNVCAASYRDFMQVIIGDMAVLSAPYALDFAPIAATLKVGLSRPNGGAYDYIDVPRSRTQGFIYDATKNTIGFKSDPIDGQCGGGACSANNVIETTEINYARTAQHIPVDGDIVYVSYRYWRPIPCAYLGCSASQSCVRLICEEGDVDCTAGQLIDRCVDGAACGDCEEYDMDSGSCEPVNNSCECYAGSEQICDPDITNACPLFYDCNASTCLCEASNACGGSILDPETQAIASCEDAVACCTSDEYANTCCAEPSQVRCFSDPESGENTVYCAASPCDCSYCTGEGMECCPECPPRAGAGPDPDHPNVKYCDCFTNPQ